MCEQPQLAVDRTLDVGPLSVDLLRRGPLFAGIGAVTTPLGLPLRRGERPMDVELRTPEGVELVDYRLTGCEPTAGGGWRLTLRLSRLDGGPMEFQLHSGRARYRVADWGRPVRPADGTTLTLQLSAVTRDIGGRRFRGLRYQYHYRSTDLPLYRILDRGTWEVGGAATGNELWLRGAAPTVQRFDHDADGYCSGWTLPTAGNPFVFQFKPLQTQLQGFTFTAHDAGVLVTWATTVHHVRTLLQKDAGDRSILHLHEHCGDLSLQLSSAPMEVLFWPAPGLDAVARANCYHDVRELVHEELHAQAGLRRERVKPMGMIEEWGPADLVRYADVGLPKLADAGIAVLEIANQFANNMNVYGVANMCCTLDLRVPESVGPDRLRRLCAAAARGIDVRMWASTALSTLSSCFFEGAIDASRVEDAITLWPPREGKAAAALRHPEAFVRDASGAVDADHYRPRFAALNLRHAPARDYWLASWRAARDELGLRGVYLDSSFNLTSDKFHYRARGRTPAVQSMYHAHVDLVAQLQRMGLSYSGEDHGVFGVHRSGFDLAENLDHLHLWEDCQFDFDVPAVRAAGHDERLTFFRGLAFRVVWMLHWDPRVDRLSFHQGGFRGEFDAPAPWHLRMLRAFGAAEPFMRQRAILPDFAAVRYRHEDATVWWTFAEQTLDLGDAAHEVCDLVSNERKVVRGAATLPALGVTLVRPAPQPEPGPVVVHVRPNVALHARPR